jgi:mannose-6-phosphate isomerase-like protein (cupin superfamily)
MIIHLSGEQTRGQLTLIEGTMWPGGDGGLHVHLREDETMHLLEGELDVTIGEQALRLRPGESYFAPRGVPHRLRNRGNVAARSLVIHTPAGFDEFIRRAGIPMEDASSGTPASPDQLRHVVELAASFGVKLLKPPGHD